MTFVLWDKIRLFMKRGNIYSHESLFQNQSDPVRVFSGHDVPDLTDPNFILEQTNVQINRLERYKDYDQMDEVGEISLALDMYCLHGDTKIPLLDGSYPTIKELTESGKKEFWVYSYDIENDQYVPAKACNPHISGRNANMVEVLFDDGLIIKCTPNHKFLTTSGFIEANNLCNGQSVVPLYKTKSPPLSSKHDSLVERKYEFIQLKPKCWKATHQWVWEMLHGDRNGVIHHIDFDKYNNSPDNFKLMSWHEHAELHRKLSHLSIEAQELKRKKCSEKIKLKWQDPEYIKKLIPHCRNRGKQLNSNGHAFKHTEEYSKVTWHKLQEYINNGGDLSSVRKIASNLNCAQRVINRLFERNDVDIDYYRKAFVGNHKVISVTPCDDAVEVYDIFIDKYHCFAAGSDKSWVIVHNSDEASLRDPERNHSIFVKTQNKRLKDEIEEYLYNTVNIDSSIRPMTRYLSKFGDLPLELVPTHNRDGLTSFRVMPVYNFTRAETKYGDLVGFFYQEDDGGKPEFYHPWQVVHMRLTSFEKIFHPYGKSILDGARRDFRRLRLMEDAALVYRLTRAPEKRMFKVPVGNLPPKEREQYLQIIARRFKKHKFIDPTTGALNERYAPHIQDDDYWVPVTGDGSGVEVDTLQGAENLDAIADIEYFKKKMVAALKIPFHRVGLGNAEGDPGKSIASQSPEFSKAVQWIQDQIIVGIKKMVLVHLTLRGYTIDDMTNFELSMTSASAIDELYRIETWASRVDIMGGIKDLGIFPDEWIIERFTDMTADELELIKKMKKLSGEIEKVNEEDTEEFFEDKKRDKLLLEFQIKELHDEYNTIKNEKSKYSNISSFQKMINESEFDGIDDVDYLDDDKKNTKLIIENILSDTYLDSEDSEDSEDLEDLEYEDVR